MKLIHSPRHGDGHHPDDGDRSHDLVHVLRPLLLRTHDQPSPVERDRSDRDGRDEDRGALEEAHQTASDLKKKGFRPVTPTIP